MFKWFDFTFYELWQRSRRYDFWPKRQFSGPFWHKNPDRRAQSCLYLWRRLWSSWPRGLKCWPSITLPWKLFRRSRHLEVDWIVQDYCRWVWSWGCRCTFNRTVAAEYLWCCKWPWDRSWAIEIRVLRWLWKLTDTCAWAKSTLYL